MSGLWHPGTSDRAPKHFRIVILDVFRTLGIPAPTPIVPAHPTAPPSPLPPGPQAWPPLARVAEAVRGAGETPRAPIGAGTRPAGPERAPSRGWLDYKKPGVGAQSSPALRRSCVRPGRPPAPLPAALASLALARQRLHPAGGPAVTPSATLLTPIAGAVGGAALRRPADSPPPPLRLPQRPSRFARGGGPPAGSPARRPPALASPRSPALPRRAARPLPLLAASRAARAPPPPPQAQARDGRGLRRPKPSWAPAARVTPPAPAPSAPSPAPDDFAPFPRLLCAPRPLSGLWSRPPVFFRSLPFAPSRPPQLLASSSLPLHAPPSRLRRPKVD